MEDPASLPVSAWRGGGEFHCFPSGGSDEPFEGDSFKDLALVLGVTFGIPLLAAVFYSLYGAIFCFFSIFSVRDAIFISAEEIPMRGINPLVRDFAVAITALVFIVSLVACVSMFLP